MLFTLKEQNKLGIKFYHIFDNTLTLRSIHLVVCKDILAVRKTKEVSDLIGECYLTNDFDGLCSWASNSKTIFIFLEYKNIRYATIVHEATHAVGRMYELIGIDAKPADELIAAGVGFLSEAIIYELKNNGYTIL